MSKIISYWKYRNLWERLIRRRTYYHYNEDEGITIAYQLRKNGSLWCVDIDHNGS